MKWILICLCASTGLAMGQIQYNHGDPTAYEQLMLELVNRARANPDAEAARLGITLNQGVSVPLITSVPKSPLASHRYLIDASVNHSQWMLDTDVFSHTGQGNTTAKQRMEAAGYVFSTPWSSGENIGWRGTTASLDPGVFTPMAYEGLFLSPGHRKVLCDDSFNEVGTGIRLGTFLSGGLNYNAIMVTQNFAKSESSPRPLVVGVIYYDFDGGGFYSVGEGIGGISATIAGGTHTTKTASAGGYALPAPALEGPRMITFSGPGINQAASIGIPSAANVKKDLALIYRAPEITGNTKPVAGLPAPYAISQVPGATALHVTVASKAPAPADNANTLSGLYDETSSSYSALSTSVKYEGLGAYHLARSSFEGLEILRYRDAFLAGPTSRLQFWSQLGWATSDQLARVEVSTDGGLTWTAVFEQAGTGMQEPSFSLRTVSLAAFSGKIIQLRFNYIFAGGSCFLEASDGYGWLIDAITFSGLDRLSTIQTETLAPGESFDFIPPAKENYLLQVGPEHFGRLWPTGPVFEVSAEAPAAGYSAWATSWELSHSLVPGTISNNPATDLRGDGLSNLLRFALGGSPETSAMALFPSSGIADVAGQRYLTFSHRRLEGVGSGTTASGYTVQGLTYLIQTSVSLSPDSWKTGPAFLQETSVISAGNGSETVTVRLVAPMISRQFLRLQVTK